MGTTKTYGLGGGVAGTSEVDDNLNPSVLIESTDGKDYIEVDTTDSAEKLILGLGGADILLRTDGSDMGYYSYGNRHLSMVGGFRIEPVAGTTEFLQHPTSSLDPMWSTGRHIRFRLTGTDKAFKVENSGGTVRLWVSENGKIATGNEDTPLVAAGGIHIKAGEAGASSIHADYDGLYIEDSVHTGLTIHAGTAASGNKRAGIGFGHGGATVSGALYYTNNAAAPVFNVAMGPGGASCMQYVQNSQGSRRPILGADWFFMPRNDVVDNNTDTDAVWLDDSGATLVVDFANGNAAMVTLTANITAVKFINTPDSYSANVGLVSTVTVRFQQHASSAKTISYAVGTTSVHTGDEDSAAHGSSELYWSGGVPHTMSTGTDDVDIVQFTIFADRETNYNVYGTVIGQDFQTV